MTGAVILWTHALVALLFGWAAMRPGRATGLPRASFAAALGATALWALAVAGIDARDLATRLAESGRDVAWLAFMLALVRRGHAGGWGQVVVHGAVMLVALTAAAVAAMASVVASAAVVTTLVILRMMTAAGALVLARDLLPRAGRGGAGLVSWGVIAIWATDLLVFSMGYLLPGHVPALVAARGLAMIAVGLLIATGARRGGDWTPALSRAAAIRSVAAVALALYVGLVVLATTLAGQLGASARAVQTGIVLGASVAIFTLVSTPWMRSWTGVMVAKHLFRHRYDYRAEWQKFADMLGRPGEDAPPLAARVVRAMAELTSSPAGLLMQLDGTELVPTTAWQWPDGTEAVPQTAAYLSRTHRIVALDEVRAGTAPDGEAAAVPRWMADREDAWALVPLLHAGALVGAILLARPLVDRRLDWEDLDLLRVAGRQAASYLAEERAHAALADARRFDEFNRRFAFILHDIKNVASQLSLVARNAERHADNPDFRADMITTLRSSADQMTTLLARLSPGQPGKGEPIRPTDLSRLTAEIAGERRAGHPVACRADPPVWAAAAPGRLAQVLRHLVQNAAEASPAGEPVRLSASVHGDAAAIEVADRGGGMSAAFVRDRLFRPFVSTKPGGFGIGTFEARQLVEAMGGRLEVESREGEGSRFRILLPRAAAMEQAA